MAAAPMRSSAAFMMEKSNDCDMLEEKDYEEVELFSFSSNAMKEEVKKVSVKQVESITTRSKPSFNSVING